MVITCTVDPLVKGEVVTWRYLPERKLQRRSMITEGLIKREHCHVLADQGSTCSPKLLQTKDTLTHSLSSKVVCLCRHPPSSRWLTLIDTNKAAHGIKKAIVSFTILKSRYWMWPATKCTTKCIKKLPVASVCSLEPSVLVTLHEIKVFLPSFLSTMDSISTVLPSGMGLEIKESPVRTKWPWMIIVIRCGLTLAQCFLRRSVGTWAGQTQVNITLVCVKQCT